jgi:hypothetical protein
MRGALPADTHAAFSRAVLYGVGGALVGLCIYAGFEILTNFTIGYLALAVGWIVAKAMMKGSDGIGGRRYQITAVALTYFAVSVAAIPVFLYSYSHERSAQTHKVQQQNVAPSADASASDGSAPSAQDSADSNSAPAPQKEQMGFFKAIVVLVGIGLASPFLEFTGSNPFGALIGLVILSVGLRIAWKLTAGVRIPQVEGPF